MICGSSDCDAQALVTALWPGQESAKCLCCAVGLFEVAQVMGFTLYFGHLAIAAEPLAREVEEWLTGKEDPTHYDPNEGVVGPEFRRSR